MGAGASVVAYLAQDAAQEAESEAVATEASTTFEWLPVVPGLVQSRASSTVAALNLEPMRGLRLTLQKPRRY